MPTYDQQSLMENNRNKKQKNKRGMFGLPYVMSIDTDMVQDEKIKTCLRIRGGPAVVYSGGQDIIEEASEMLHS